MGYAVDGLIRYGNKVYGLSGIEWNQVRTSLSGTSTTGLVDVQSIAIPLMIGVNLSEYPDLNPRLYGGISFTYITSINENLEGYSKNDFHESILGLRGGIGLDLIIFSFDLEYIHSLTPLFNANKNTTYGMLKFTTGILINP